MQLQNLITDIEKINRKEIDRVKSDKPDTEKRERIQISDEVIMIDRIKGWWWIKIPIKEQVNKNHRKKSDRKKQKRCFRIRYIRTLWKRSDREKVLFKKTENPTKGYEDYPFHTDNIQDTSNEESEERYQREERKKYHLESNHQTLMKEIR